MRGNPEVKVETAIVYYEAAVPPHQKKSSAPIFHPPLVLGCLGEEEEIPSHGGKECERGRGNVTHWSLRAVL
jgi:hypothetical protein